MFISCSTIGGISSKSDDDAFLRGHVRTLHHVKDVGYTHIETYFDKRPERVADEISDTINNLGLIAYSIHLPKLLLTYEKQAIEENLESISKFIQLNDIKIAVLHPPFVQQLIDQEWRKRMEMVMEAMEDVNCLLTLEIIPYLRNPHFFIQEQIRDYPDRPLGVTVDLEYMHVTGLKIEWVWRYLGEQVANIHFRDSDGCLVDENGKRKYLNPGDGELDLQHVVQKLDEYDYTGPITIEVSHRDPQNIVKSRLFVERCLENLNHR